MASLYGYTTPVMGSHFVIDKPDSVNLKCMRMMFFLPMQSFVLDISMGLNMCSANIIQPDWNRMEVWLHKKATMNRWPCKGDV